MIIEAVGEEGLALAILMRSRLKLGPKVHACITIYIVILQLVQPGSCCKDQFRFDAAAVTSSYVSHLYKILQ